MRKHIFGAALAATAIIFLAPLAASAMTSEHPYPATDCSGHPRNQAGYVTDGTPQCEGPTGPPGNKLQWCAGTPEQKDQCDAAMHHGFITSGRPQLDDEHCTGTQDQVNACLAARHPQQVQAASASPSSNAGIPGSCYGHAMSYGEMVNCFAPVVNQYPWDTNEVFHIMYCESTGNTNAYNGRYVGLMQEDGGSTDPYTNIAAAYNEYYHGRGNSWGAWSCA